MPEENESPMTKEECRVLMEKLGRVEDLILSVPDADTLIKGISNFEAVSEKIDSLEGAVAKMASIEDVDKGFTAEDIMKTVSDAVAPLKERIKELEGTPLFKGTQSVEDPQVEDPDTPVDVLKGVFMDSFKRPGE